MKAEPTTSKCRHCGDHGWVYVPVVMGKVLTIQRVRCNCLQSQSGDSR